MRARSHSVTDDCRSKMNQSTGFTSIQRKESLSLHSHSNINTTNQKVESIIIKELECQLNAARNEIKELKEIIAALQPNQKYLTSWEEEEELVAKETA